MRARNPNGTYAPSGMDETIAVALASNTEFKAHHNKE